MEEGEKGEMWQRWSTARKVIQPRSDWQKWAEGRVWDSARDEKVHEESEAVYKAEIQQWKQ